MQTASTDDDDGAQYNASKVVVDVEDPANAADGDDGGVGSTSSDDNEHQRNSNTTKKWRLISLAAFLVATAVIVVAVSLTITLGDGGKRNESKNGNALAVAISLPQSNATRNDSVENNDFGYDGSKIMESSKFAKKHSTKSNKDILGSTGYNSCDDLKDDIRRALNQYVNTIIAAHANEDVYECLTSEGERGRSRTLVGDQEEVGDLSFIPTLQRAPVVDSASTSPRLTRSKSSKEDSFGTKNQVYGVDEADFVKSDGENLYAAKGEFLYAWNAIDGVNKVVSITELPYEKVNICCEWTSSCTTDTGVQENELCYFTQPKPKIVGLLLHGKRLAAIVSDDTSTHLSLIDSVQWMPGDNTTIRVYDISSIPSDGSPLKLLAKSEKPIMASFIAARSIGNNAIIVVANYFNFDSLKTKLDRSENYCDLNSTEYTKLAGVTALNEMEPFVDRMWKELPVQLVGSCGSIVPISALYAGEITHNANSGNRLSSFVQVLSFDMASDFPDENVAPGVTGVFLQGNSKIYATQDFMVLLSDESCYDTTTKQWDSASFILGFDISVGAAASPRPFCFSRIPGQAMINQFSAEMAGLVNDMQYSIDLYEDCLRVITIASFTNEITNEFSYRTTSTRVTLTVLKVPDPSEADANMLLVGETSIVLTPIDLGGEKTGVDSVECVRFMGDKAYIKTYYGITHVYDLSNPSDPKKVGEVSSRSPYSTYLEPIIIDGVPCMLEIGHQRIEGRATGFKISLLDISDPTNIKEIASFVEEEDFRSSSASYDSKSSRYLEQSQKLIIPLNIQTMIGISFDGFVVYDIRLDDISRSYDIPHPHDLYSLGCNESEYFMSGRSFVFDSKLTTILSHSVIITDLETGENMWTMINGTCTPNPRLGV